MYPMKVREWECLCFLVREKSIALPWAQALLDEFFAQAAKETTEGLPVMPFMDPKKVELADSQIG
jgi:hypothetical protein